MQRFALNTLVVAVSLCAAAPTLAQSPAQCAGLSGSGRNDCLRALQALSDGPVAADTAAAPGSVTTLNIDTGNTGVDLGLAHNPDGSITPKTARTGVRTPPLSNGAAAASGGTASAAQAPVALGNGIGGVNDPSALAKPGTSTFGNPSSAGRENGNSGTNNGRSTPGVTGGTGIVNSGTPGNGLPDAASGAASSGTGTAASGNTGAGPAASGNTGAGAAASGNTGVSGTGSTDAATAAQAASSTRMQNGTEVSGRILGGRTLGGANGPGLSNGNSAATSGAGGSAGR
jgi:hypothetical protein